MLKNISNLGVTLNKLEQKSINGGLEEPVNNICVPIGQEAVCLVRLDGDCCLIWD